MVNKVHNSKKTLVGALLALIAVVGLFAGLYFGLMPKAAEGQKNITVQLVLKDSERTVEIATDAEMLGDALTAEGLIEGEEGPYGMFIRSVDGYTADENAQEWWCLTKGGEDVFTGVDMTPIADGEAYELTLKTGW